MPDNKQYIAHQEITIKRDRTTLETIKLVGELKDGAVFHVTGYIRLINGKQVDDQGKATDKPIPLSKDKQFDMKPEVMETKPLGHLQNPMDIKFKDKFQYFTASKEVLDKFVPQRIDQSVQIPANSVKYAVQPTVSPDPVPISSAPALKQDKEWMFDQAINLNQNDRIKFIGKQIDANTFQITGYLHLKNGQPVNEPINKQGKATEKQGIFLIEPFTISKQQMKGAAARFVIPENEAQRFLGKKEIIALSPGALKLSAIPAAQAAAPRQNQNDPQPAKSPNQQTAGNSLTEVAKALKERKFSDAAKTLDDLANKAERNAKKTSEGLQVRVKETNAKKKSNLETAAGKKHGEELRKHAEKLEEEAQKNKTPLAADKVYIARQETVVYEFEAKADIYRKAAKILKDNPAAADKILSHKIGNKTLGEWLENGNHFAAQSIIFRLSGRKEDVKNAEIIEKHIKNMMGQVPQSPRPKPPQEQSRIPGITDILLAIVSMVFGGNTAQQKRPNNPAVANSSYAVITHSIGSQAQSVVHGAGIPAPQEAGPNGIPAAGRPITVAGDFTQKNTPNLG